MHVLLELKPCPSSGRDQIADTDLQIEGSGIHKYVHVCKCRTFLSSLKPLKIYFVFIWTLLCRPAAENGGGHPLGLVSDGDIFGRSF